MSTNKNNTPDETRLLGWGDAERNAPPTRRGSFVALVSRLTKRESVAGATPVSWWQPVLAVGIASCVTVSAAMGMMAEQGEWQEKHDAEILVQHARDRDNQRRYVANLKKADGLTNQERYLANYKREVTRKRSNVADWNERGLTDYKNGIAARCRPVFLDSGTAKASVGNHSSATVPLSVVIQNSGATFRGEIIVSSGSEYVIQRAIAYPVTIAGNGATTRQIVYPELGSDNSHNYYTVRLRTPEKTFLLESGFVSATAGAWSESNANTENTVAILDKRIGVLSPRRREFASYGGFSALYAKPDTAPDRASGYDAVDTLILGHGCETLTPAQWGAIREWVKDGGSLVLMGGSAEMRRVIAAPEALALSPAEAIASEKRSAVQKRRVTYFDSGDALHKGFFMSEARNFPSVMSTIPLLKTDALIREQSPMQDKGWTNIAARRTLGAGTVSLYGYDMTSDAFRDDPYALPGAWMTIARISGGALPAKRMRSIGAYANTWDERLYESGEYAPPLAPGIANPFYTRFPDLSLITYTFLGYFMLVVPVSFVVLKQTRRMHYAWFTAPALAAVFAGSLAVSTRSLYDAPQAVRTSGVLALDAGDPVARFHGFSELYAPRAGRYTLNLPGTEQSFENRADYYNESQKNSDFPVSHSVDNGTGETPPPVDIGNLSFKRVYHSQTMTLGTGITLAVAPSGNGRHEIEATLTNGTGQPLRNVHVYLRGENTATKSFTTGVPIWEFKAGQIGTGSQKIVLANYMYTKSGNTYSYSRTGQNIQGVLPIFNDRPEALPPRTPFLTAEISGQPFAPQGLGKWAGGETSVKLVAKLPAVPQSAMPTHPTIYLQTNAKTSAQGGNTQ